MKKVRMVFSLLLVILLLQLLLLPVPVMASPAAGYDAAGDAFWQDAYHQVVLQSSGTVLLDAGRQDGDYVPFFVLDALRERGVSLQIAYCGKVYTLQGGRYGNVAGLAPGKSYLFVDLAKMGFDDAAALFSRYLVTVPLGHPTTERKNSNMLFSLPAGWRADTDDNSIYFSANGEHKLWIPYGETREDGTSLYSYTEQRILAELEVDVSILVEKQYVEMKPGTWAGYFVQQSLVGGHGYSYIYAVCLSLLPGQFLTFFFYSNVYEPQLFSSLILPFASSVVVY